MTDVEHVALPRTFKDLRALLDLRHIAQEQRCTRHGGVFYTGCMGICSRAPQGARSCPMPRGDA